MRSALRALQFRARRLRHRPLDRDTLRSYWTSPPDEGNQPDAYLHDVEGAVRSRFLVDLLSRHAGSGSVLELGCNAGRNLKHLHDAGWTDLAAIEVSATAVETLRRELPELASVPVTVGTLEDELPKVPDRAFDVVFSMAVLEHVHYDSDWLLAHVARVAARFVVTIENEEEVSDRTFPRHYGRVFEGLGLREVESTVRPPGAPDGFVARVFAVS